MLKTDFEANKNTVGSNYWKQSSDLKF